MTGKKIKTIRFKEVLFIYFLLAIFWVGCGPKQKKEEKTATTEEKIRVTVSIVPQQYFVQRIAGDRAVVNVMVPSSQSPDSYEPTPRQMQELNHSQVYFQIGPLIFETVWVASLRANTPHLKIVDTSAGIQLITYEEHGEEHPMTHQAGVHQGHEHKGVDPHTWLSPTAVKTQITHIKDTFIELDPTHRDFYEANYAAFTREIDALHREFSEIFRDSANRKFMVFHPAWSYFARDYHLTQLPIEVEGKTPGPATLKKVIDVARKENIHFIIVQQQSDTHNAEAVAADINGKVVLLDPLELNWLENMKKIVHAFTEILNNRLKETPK